MPLLLISEVSFDDIPDDASRAGHRKDTADSETGGAVALRRTSKRGAFIGSETGSDNRKTIEGNNPSDKKITYPLENVLDEEEQG